METGDGDDENVDGTGAANVVETTENIPGEDIPIEDIPGEDIEDIPSNSTADTYTTATEDIDHLVIDEERLVVVEHSLPSARHSRSASTPVTVTSVNAVENILRELRTTIHPGLDLAITTQNILSRRVSKNEMRNILTAVNNLIDYTPNVPGLLPAVNPYFMDMWIYYRSETREMDELSNDEFICDMHILFWAMAKLCKSPEMLYYVICKIFKCTTVEEAFGKWLPGFCGFGRKYAK